MDKKDFNNRKVDKVPINKSKEYLWKYIQAKTDMKAKESFSFSGFFQSLFAKTPKFAYAAPLAILLVFALLFTNLSGIFDIAESTPYDLLINNCLALYKS